MSNFQFKSWRVRMSFSRQQAADKLGVSVHTIKSYELGKRMTPAPTRQLMKKIEKDKTGSHGVPGAGIKIVGGGSGIFVTPYLSVCAIDYGANAQAILSLCQAHDRSADLVLTKMSEQSSEMESAQDLMRWVEELKNEPKTHLIFWSAAVVDTSHPMLQTPDIHTGPSECDLLKAIKKINKNIFLVAFLNTKNLSPQEQFEQGQQFLHDTGANLVLVSDLEHGMNMVVSPHPQKFYETTDKEVALAGLVEMSIFRNKTKEVLGLDVVFE